MRRLFIQLGVVIFIGSMLAGCSNDGPVFVADPAVFFVERLALGEPVFKDVVKPIYGRSSSDPEDSISLLSYDPAIDVLEDINPDTILNSKSGISVALNTVDDSQGRSEISILVSDDSVFKIDHLTGEIRMLNHFINQVCEIIPVDVVKTQVAGIDVTHTVLNGDWIYVLTAEAQGGGCFGASSTKRFIKLPLNFQFNAQEPDDNTTELTAVSESEARAQLIFGWVDDEVTTATDDQRLDYGYFGWGLLDTAYQLRFFNAQREEQWKQERVLQAFPFGNLGQGNFSPEHLVKLTELDKFQYMLQLGLDVFVFDSSSELFAIKSDLTAGDVLTDRTLKIKPLINNNVEVVQAVEALFDTDEIIFVDDAKIFRHNYVSSFVAPTTTRNFTVKRQPVLDVEVDHGGARFFSQFDLRSCIGNSNEAACIDAHNLDPSTNDTWQFLVDCTPAVSCSLNQEVVDFCATQSELDVDPNAGELCTASNYRHLIELNEPANDAEFRGFMQYDANFVRGLDFLLDRDSLYITARMLEKDILLRYQYNVDLTEPKPNREVVLFGERVRHFGLETYISENNLFATVLWGNTNNNGVRSNECYKNLQRVTCDLGDIENNGIPDSCTGKDLAEGLCFDEFIEYESLALFCSAVDIDSGACTDNQLIPTNNLSVEGSLEDAKWIAIQDFTQGAPAVTSMHLFLGDEAEVVDEGILVNPQLVPVDDEFGTVISGEMLVTLLQQRVESVVGGRIADTVFGRFDVIADDVIQGGVEGVTGTSSLANVYFLADPKSVAGTATKVSELNLLRPSSP